MTRFADREPARWKQRRTAAVAIRLIVLLAPVAVSVGASLAITRLVPAPADHAERVAWLVGIVVACSLLAWPARRLLRRLLPLAALFEMSLLFPGEMPTRWKVAREAGSIKHLELLASGVPDRESSKAAITILALVASLARHDPLTRGHSNRVRVLTDLIAEEMALPQADRDRLRWAALVHDVGKLEVPAKLLNKPGKPTQEEWETLRLHPQAGADLTEPLAHWLGPYSVVAVQHHERYDGTGYPAGLRGHEISLGARIVGLADAFEVMTASRPYKRAMTRSAALQEVITLRRNPVRPGCRARVLGGVDATSAPGAWPSQFGRSTAGHRDVARHHDPGAGERRCPRSEHRGGDEYRRGRRGRWRRRRGHCIGTQCGSQPAFDFDRTTRRLPQPERCGASRCGDGATRGRQRSAQHRCERSITNRRVAERFAQPAVSYHRAGGDTHGGRRYAQDATNAR